MTGFFFKFAATFTVDILVVFDELVNWVCIIESNESISCQTCHWFSEIKLFTKDHISLPQKYKFEMMWAVR